MPNDAREECNHCGAWLAPRTIRRHKKMARELEVITSMARHLDPLSDAPISSTTSHYGLETPPPLSENALDIEAFTGGLAWHHDSGNVGTGSDRANSSMDIDRTREDAIDAVEDDISDTLRCELDPLLAPNTPNNFFPEADELDDESQIFLRLLDEYEAEATVAQRVEECKLLCKYLALY